MRGFRCIAAAAAALCAPQAAAGTGFTNENVGSFQLFTAAGKPLILTNKYDIGDKSNIRGYRVQENTNYNEEDCAVFFFGNAAKPKGQCDCQDPFSLIGIGQLAQTPDSVEADFKAGLPGLQPHCQDMVEGQTVAALVLSANPDQLDTIPAPAATDGQAWKVNSDGTISPKGSTLVLGYGKSEGGYVGCTRQPPVANPQDEAKLVQPTSSERVTIRRYAKGCPMANRQQQDNNREVTYFCNDPYRSEVTLYVPLEVSTVVCDPNYPWKTVDGMVITATPDGDKLIVDTRMTVSGATTTTRDVATCGQCYLTTGSDPLSYNTKCADGGSGLGVGPIIGIVVGVLVLLGLCFLAYFIVRRSHATASALGSHSLDKQGGEQPYNDWGMAK